MHLVLPVYRGGDYFPQCLESLAPHANYFKVVWISINGPKSNADYYEAISWKARLSAGNVRILITGQELPPLEHARFYLTELREQGVRPDELVANLFHDDVMTAPPGVIPTNQVLLGNWRVGNEDFTTAFSSSNPSGVFFAQHWVNNMGFHGIYTNGSGIIAPWQVHFDVANFMNPKFQGARYEYMLATHSIVEAIQVTNSPWVTIRTHSRQAGAGVSGKSHAKSEISFLLWLARNGRIRGFRGMVVFVFLVLSFIWQLRRAGKR